MARFSDPAFYALSMIMGGNINQGLTLLEGLAALPGAQMYRLCHWCSGNTKIAAGFRGRRGAR